MADALTAFQVSVLPLGGPPARAVINDEDLGEFPSRRLNHMKFKRQEKYDVAAGAAPPSSPPSAGLIFFHLMEPISFVHF